ncbi:MarR family transcriptional regulator [Microbacterium sp. Gd 4-13]|uniref:MarR family winged helix-turn-helix transcriptional regulator n=1 Tax=Microbacterium sp. Gd 4-13 TaxID=2173179 RepID=UPI000D56C447|nr:MarR family transcriptional regulator [Microbacterium sp. Gd 4-13]PVW03312.1 MarR family transcriptional regulator [Microbacterium sp. Gd 4-13]
MTLNDTGAFWYSSEEQVARGRRLLHALRLYQAAEVAMRRRTRAAMSMGENELAALRFIIRRHTQGRAATPTDVAKYLGVSTASTTALIDRLESSGYITRRPHPTDRRSVTIAATESADDAVRATLGDMHERMMRATREVGEPEAEAIVAFLERMTDAVDQVSAEPH